MKQTKMENDFLSKAWSTYGNFDILEVPYFSIFMNDRHLYSIHGWLLFVLYYVRRQSFSFGVIYVIISLPLNIFLPNSGYYLHIGWIILTKI